MDMTTAGRPTKQPGQPADQRVAFRATPEQKKQYQEAADLAGVPLSEWVKSVLDRAAKRATRNV